ncbi:MAG: TolC family protein [Chlorobi bacterium]|nr:TolC family protein [Chlorobiota bacterium]
MYKLIFLMLFTPLVLLAQDEVKSISELFDSLKVNPNIRADELKLERALAGKRIATGELFPKIDAFGSYNYSSTPTGMVPVPPDDLINMVQDRTIPQPFSENIFRAGATMSMPIFVKSLYTMANKAKKMYQSTEAQKNIDLLKNEAVLVSSNANLLYIDALNEALTKKKESLLKTKEFVQMQVDNGRLSGSALLKINTGINEVDIMRNQIAQNRAKVISAVYSLTNVKLNKPIEMTQTGTYENGELKVLEPLQKKTDAMKLGVRVQKEMLYPALVLNGMYTYNYAKSYNLPDQGVNENFATVGVTLKIPIFEKSQYSKIKMSKIEFEESENELAKMRLEFTAQAEQLEKTLVLLNNSTELYKKSVKDKEELLKIAKVAYESDRMSTEDYLKYEDDLLMERSKLYQTEAQRWQTLMKLAVIYGNSIEEMVK